MAYLTAALILVGLLALINLVFTFGVVRRLREHTAELAALRGSGVTGVGGTDVALPAGATVGAFETAEVGGRPVSLAAMGERPLVGFFSPHCAPCKERLPLFAEHAASRPGGAGEVLAVVVGTPEETSDVVAQLLPVATVVVEPDQGPVQRAFGVSGFPAFVLLEDGVVGASGFDFEPVASRDAAAAVPSAG
ncbi:TlpA family protein disulfide reductase [Nonomuraea pusilla]|uniref:Thiol-disulfide isomerase or thioredoxin n=1 Tax=Nonomuraea pusilla TaxID=46177 RepID=A0A1H7Q4W5_9ACTN|nr:redoxin domain-containing protein [Nonomuraea pusilla]SEL42906.1 Thiol-disulfide isomerase or thioredoxin [Nonomuraea pusilla]